MFNSASIASDAASPWHHHVANQEEDLVRELIHTNNVDAVLARMEKKHLQNLTPIVQKMASYDAVVSTPHHRPSAPAALTSPRMGTPPPPPPPEPRTFDDASGVNGVLGAQPSSYLSRMYPPTSPAPTAFSYSRENGDASTQPSPKACQLPPPPSPSLEDFAYTSLDAHWRLPGESAAGLSSLNDAEKEHQHQTTMDTWLWPGTGLSANQATASQQLHLDHALDLKTNVSGRLRPPIPSADRYRDNADVQQPRMTTKGTSSLPPRLTAPLLATTTSDLGDLENPAQSRIARQLQLLRNYRELAELCSSTQSPSVDLFRALPSESLARMQAEQLKELTQREHTPITVHNNYYFGNDSNERGDSVRHVPVAAAIDSDIHDVIGYRPHGTALSQSRKPLVLTLPRAVPLQSPQLSSGTDSPPVTPPLSQRSGNLAPPSPSRSQRGRSHGSRLFDVYCTPTATTEEAGSSYVDDDDEDYAGDFMDDSDGEGDAYEDNAGHRRPPPRIIEREQHRRFQNPSTAVDGFPFAAQGVEERTLQHPTPSQLQCPRQRQNSYPGDRASNHSFMLNEHLRDASSGIPPGLPSGPTRPENASSHNGVHGAPVSDGGKRSPSSVINILSGEPELRANAQRQGFGGRGTHEERGPSPSPKERRMSAAISNASPHTTAASPRPNHPKRSLSANSSSMVLNGTSAPTDLGVSQDSPPPNSSHQVRRERRGSAQSDRGRNERGADWNRDGNSVDHNVDKARSGSRGLHSDSSEVDTPGNPQLQTRDPLSLAKHQRHIRRRHKEPHPFPAGREHSNSSPGHNYDSRRSDLHPSHGQAPLSPTHRSADRRANATSRPRKFGNIKDDEMFDVRSAASYSCSYTTSSDISDYMPGSYYSPIRQLDQRDPRSSARGHRSNAGKLSGESQQLWRLSPQAIRSSATVQGGHRHGATTPGAGDRGPRSLSARSQRPVVAGGCGGFSPQGVVYQARDQQQRRARLLAGRSTQSQDPSISMAGVSARQRGGVIRLPDGRVTSPESKLYQNRILAGVPEGRTTASRRVQPQATTRPSASMVSSCHTYTGRISGGFTQNSPPHAVGSRASSPSAVQSVSTTGRRGNGDEGNSVHIQQGLLYGSLLPKARPETALVVKEEHGRTRSVDPHATPNHAPLLGRGSVCPVQPFSVSSTKPLHLHSDDATQADVFPIVRGAAHGSTTAGVQPLEWKSSGSGCVVGRSGHVPVSPRGKTSTQHALPGPHNEGHHERGEATVEKNSRAASIPHQPAVATALTTNAARVPHREQRYHPPHTTDAGQRISISPPFSARSRYGGASAPVAISSKLTQSRRGTPGASANAQQRYTPSPQAFNSAMGNLPQALVPHPSNPYSSSKATAATRNANAQRFGIAPLRQE